MKMKRYKFNATLTLITLFTFSLLGCESNSDAKFSDVYILIDVTDKSFRDNNIILESVPKILNKMNIDPDKLGMSGGEVKIFTINDLSETKSLTVKLPQGVEGLLGQNPLDRQDEIKKFQSELSSSISTVLKNRNWDKEKSKIYQNVCRELNNLKRTNSKHSKTMIVFSDMLENSELLSFYRDDTDSLITDVQNFDKNKLGKDCRISDLSDVEFFVVTNRNKQNDELINKAERFWKALFKTKKIKHFSFDAELHIN
jgi:hypothetical protein